MATTAGMPPSTRELATPAKASGSVPRHLARHRGRLAGVEDDEPQGGEIGELVHQVRSPHRGCAAVLGLEEEDSLRRICRRAAVAHEVEHVTLLVAEGLAQCPQGGSRGLDDLEAGRRAHGLLQVRELASQIERGQVARIGGDGENAEGVGRGAAYTGRATMR